MGHQPSQQCPAADIDAVGTYLQALRTRMPWETAQKAFQSADLPRGRGWDQTIAKLLARDWTAEELADLARLYSEHLLCGEKSVAFYELTDAQMAAVRAKLDSLKLDGGILAAAYPFPIAEDVLAQQKPTKPVLVAVEKDEDGIALIFSSIRQVVMREEIPVDALPKEAAAALSNFSDVIGLKSVKLQSFDVTWVPHHGNVVRVMVDCPKGVPQDGVSFIHYSIQEKLDGVLGVSAFQTPVNLFPLIDALYQDPTQGNVVELAFLTPTTASTKHEKMRRSGTCLRKEIYHKAGMAAVKGQIDPYRISVEWPNQIGEVVSAPELSLNGRAEMALAGGAVLNAAIVRKCVGRVDFDAVQERITPLIFPDNDA